VIGGLAIGAASFFAPVAVADPVTARGSERDGIARMVFTWPSPVPFVARVQNRQLVIQFSRPAEGNFAGLARRLSKYIRTPQSRDGGRTLIFPLRGNFDLNYSSRGRTVVVEVIDPNPPAEAAPAPAARPVQQVTQTPNSAKSASTSPVAANVSERVSVRTGEHPAYGRIVFDWKKRVGYKVAKQGNLATVTFERPANIGVAPLNGNSLANVRGANAQIGANSTIIGLSVSSTSRLKHFRSGSKVVVDVLNPTGQRDAPPIAQLVPRIADSKQVAAKPAPKPAVQPPAVIQTEAEKAPKSAAVGAPKATTQAANAPRALKPANVVAEPTPAAPVQESSSAANVKAVSLRLDWRAPVAAAVFRRAGNLWMIFDKPTKIDVAKLKTQGGKALRSIVQVPSNRATVLRVVTVQGINPSLRRDGLAWIFDFKKQPLGPQTPIEVKSQPSSPAGPRLFASIAESGEAIPLRDPEVGDNLVVVPVIPLAHGAERRYNYPQLTILPSAQGIVVKPNIDDLRVRSIQQGVELSAASKLALTPLTTKVAANAKLGSIQSLSRIFKPDTWRKMRRQKPGEFYEIRREMLDSLSETPADSKQKARMQMALLLFGNGYGYEANGVLKVIKAFSPDIESNPQYRLLRGATDFLMGRYDEALKILKHPSMDDNDEGEYWRAAAKVAAGEDVLNAAQFMSAKGSIFRPYPRAIKMELGMLTTEAAVIIGDIKAGIKYLGVLAEEDPLPKEIDQLALLEGMLKQLAGDFKGAVTAWEEVEKGEHRPSIANAVVLRSDLLLSMKKIKEKDAIKELEKLRFAWRGGGFEFALLRKLGRLYLDVADYPNGLRTLRAAASYFRGNPDAGAVTQEMTGAFTDLYLNDAADSMTPVKAIALFEEFKELTPSGEKGDEMIRKLADRLAAVDLLDRAAKLLEQQVGFRLKGVEKARVGAQLATVYILNREPKKAVDALQKSNAPGQPPEVVEQRRHLNARALIDLKRESEALIMLEDDDSRGADLLRAEVYWAKDWPKAANTLQKLVVSTGAAPGRKLDDRQAQFVLNFGVALALSGNDRGITRLSKDYLAQMDTTPFKDAFRLIASPDSVGLIDYRTVSGRVKTVSNFKNFMAAYRQRLKAGKLSQLN
jgi:tetratricopeptide (TPR) repeat protein